MSRQFALQPAWRISTFLLALMFFAGGLSFLMPVMGAIPIVLVLGALALMVQIAWCLSAYFIANKRRGRRATVAHWLFAVHAILGGAGLVLGLGGDDGMAIVLMMPVACLYFAALAIVAHAMVKAEQRPPSAENLVGSWFLLAYLFIGVWFMRPRVLAMHADG